MAFLEVIMFLLMIFCIYFMKPIYYKEQIKDSKSYKIIKLLNILNYIMVGIILVFLIVSNLLLKSNPDLQKIIMIIFNEISILVIPIVTCSICYLFKDINRNKINKVNKIFMIIGCVISVFYIVIPFIIPLLKLNLKGQNLISLTILQITMIYILILFAYELYLFFITEKLNKNVIVATNYLNNKNKLNKINKKILRKQYNLSFVFDRKKLEKLIGNEKLKILESEILITNET